MPKPTKQIIIKTEGELKELTLFDVLHDVFGTTKPKYEVKRQAVPPRVLEDLIRVKAKGKRGIEGSMVFIKFSEQDLDDLVDKWHESDSKLSLREYLGMTEEEFKKFVENR